MKYIRLFLLMLFLAGITIVCGWHAFYTNVLNQSALISQSYQDLLIASHTPGRIPGATQLGAAFEDIKAQWSEEQEDLWVSWSLDQHFFNRESIDAEERASLLALIRPIENLFHSFKEGPGFEQRGLPPGLNDSAEKYLPFSLLDFGRSVLLYCDWLALQNQWTDIWPFLEKLIIVAGDLSQTPTSSLDNAIGHKLLDETTQWLRHSLQMHPASIEDQRAFLRLTWFLKQALQNHGSLKHMMEYQVYITHKKLVDILANKKIRQQYVQAVKDLDRKCQENKLYESLGSVCPEMSPVANLILMQFPHLYFKLEMIFPLREAMRIIEDASSLKNHDQYAILGAFAHDFKQGVLSQQMHSHSTLTSIALAHLQAIEGSYPKDIKALLDKGWDKKYLENPFEDDALLTYQLEGNGYVLRGPGLGDKEVLLASPYQFPSIEN
jgi:hypothetical protein